MKTIRVAEGKDGRRAVPVSAWEAPNAVRIHLTWTDAFDLVFKLTIMGALAWGVITVLGALGGFIAAACVAG